MIKKQEMVLEAICSDGKPLDVRKISALTGLNKCQVHNAIVHLKRRGLVKVEQERRKSSYKVPPVIRILVRPYEKADYRIKKILKRIAEEK